MQFFILYKIVWLDLFGKKADLASPLYIIR